MPVNIIQRPEYNLLPVGQQLIFGVTEDEIVANKFKVKFIAEVYISDFPINLVVNDAKVGTYKTTPNNRGVGIFDFRPILETFLNPDYEGSKAGNGSRYKQATTVSVSEAVTHPIHLIDLIAQSENSIKYFAIKFDIEFAELSTSSIIPPGTNPNINNGQNSIQFTIFNGVLQYDDVLTLNDGDYGFDLGLNKLYLQSGDDQFLSNAPRTQYATLEDYGTLPFLNFVGLPFGQAIKGLITVTQFNFVYYYNGSIQNAEMVLQNYDNGGSVNLGNPASSKIMYLGAFPGNLRNWSTIFQGLAASGQVDKILITPYMDATALDPYTINIICSETKGYEPIRLAWLNQWGVWDYYTFNMKSSRSVSTKKTSYTQIKGTWNERTFKIAGYKGGKKNFRVNSTEKISINSDFITEAEAIWFEELINSTEVYIIKGFSADDINTITNKYVEPVTLTTSSYIRKTIANDRLIQYTFDIEKSKMQRTQSV